MDYTTLGGRTGHMTMDRRTGYTTMGGCSGHSTLGGRADHPVPNAGQKISHLRHSAKSFLLTRGAMPLSDRDEPPGGPVNR